MSSYQRKLYSLATDATDEEISRPGNSVEANAPGNFFKLLLARTGSKIGDRLSSPKTTLAWVLQSLGAPAIFIGLIVPIRESGSLLPQLVLSNFLKRYSVRKWAWSLGALIQGAAIAGCALVALTLTGFSAGIAIVALVSIFSLARGLSSVSAKDVLGRSLPKSKRGQLTGWAGSASGAIAIGSAALLFVGGSGEDSTLKYAIFLAAAAVLWWMAAAVNARVFEPASHEDPPESLTGGFRQQVGLLRDDVAFRDFLVVRALAVGSGLSTPFIVSLAYGRLGGGASWLGIFIIVEGLAAMLSGPLWGRWADRSSRSVLRGAMGVVAALLLAVIAYVQFGRDLGFDGLVFPLILFFLGIAHAGVRIGRKTYVVDMAEGNKRTDYVAVGNTLIGVLLVLAGLLTGMASMLAVEWALGILALSATIGVVYGSRLPTTG